MRNPKDLCSGLIFLAAGVAAFVIGRNYSMGTATHMGPGYFPTVLGGLLAVIGLATVARSLLVPGAGLLTFTWKPVGFVVVSTVLFGVLLRGAGLAVALMVLVIVSAYGSRHFSWPTVLVLGVGLTVFSILIFVKALGLPIAVLGPWLGG